MCAVDTVPISPLTTFNEFVDPTPTKLTLIISFSILINDFPEISDTSFKNIMSVDNPTAVDNPTEITVENPTGLWIILSILIILLIVASSGGTETVFVLPIPITLVNETASPAEAKLAAIAT